MKRLFIGAVFALGASWQLQAQMRNEIVIPQVGEYQTLKCDFHIHTVYSDGLVWPTVRVDEAYREGLDCIALTEHLEYRPHKDIKAGHGRSWVVAQKSTKANDILLIRGSEITRPMAPGHFNAIFVEQCDSLAQTGWRESFKQAKAQNSFFFWNHPGWDRQQPDTTLWWPEHTELLDKGCMQGIEVANGKAYYPEAHRWCIEKKLTMIGNSDIHQPIQTDIDFARGEHRTMTLVLAKERSLQGIREALENRRTIVWINRLLIGDEAYLREIFNKSVEIVNINRKTKYCDITVQNHSDLTFELKKTTHKKELEYFREYTIDPQSRHDIRIYYPEGTSKGQINFEVSNLLIAPAQGLQCSYAF